jgi:hypothetical protein
MSEMDNSVLSPFTPFDGMVFSDTQCFLCGQDLGEAKSREHVFPKWLLYRLDLWDKTITLLNRTTIPYRYLTVPCCPACNSEHLARLEEAIEFAFRKGPKQVIQTDKLLLYQWMGKIFYGLLYRELSLAADRSDPDSETITSTEMMEDYRALHGFLQSIRIPITFENFFPGSVFVFEIECAPGLGSFDYSDNPIGMTFCIRVGNTGVIACLKDDGLVLESFSELYRALDGVKLHPIQFDELCAAIFYKAFSMIRSSKYMSVTAPGAPPIVVKIPGFSQAPWFEEWKDEIFARFLESFWSKYGITFDEIFVPPNSVRTYLSQYL